MNLINALRHPIVIAGCALGLLGLLGLLPTDSTLSGALPLIRLGLATVAILALAQFLVPLLRRLPSGTVRKSRRLRCEETLSLDSRHRLALVSVDGRELLLSLQSDGSRLLVDLEQGSSGLEREQSPELDNFAEAMARSQAAR
jgi:flagellar biogenesis protein FliO